MTKWWGGARRRASGGARRRVWGLARPGSADRATGYTDGNYTAGRAAFSPRAQVIEGRRGRS